MVSMDGRDQERVTRKWAAEVKDWKSKAGGWIYTDGGAGRAIYQGWDNVFRSNRTAILDWLTQKHTAFTSFREMCHETGEGYVPTLLARGRAAADIRALADAYDAEQEKSRRSKRAYRGVGYERFVAVRTEKWYGGWTVRDTITGLNLRDQRAPVGLEYHAAYESEAIKTAQDANWRQAHGYRIGYGVEEAARAA
jgi:hypothetical protein